MRHFITACALAIAITGVAQTPYTREKVVEVDTVTNAEVLRAKARKWFVDTFKDAKEVIQMDDAATNTIVGKGWSEYSSRAGIQYTIEVSCKHGRYRYRIYDLQHVGKGGVVVQGSYAPYPSYGMLLDHERCYDPKVLLLREGMAEKQMMKDCAAMRPEVGKGLDVIAASLEAAMSMATAKSSDDW